MRLKNQKYNHQSGFVLVLALVLLAVMTLIGVSSMNSANMELKVTANARQHQKAFNAGQSLLEYAVSATGVTNEPIDFQNSDINLVQPIAEDIDGVNITGDVRYAGCSVGVGSSLQAGKGFSYNFYIINATGVNKTGTSSSIQTQGIRFPAAAC